MGKKFKKIKEKVHDFLKNAWKNYCDNMEKNPYYMFPTFYPHNFMFYENIMKIREERNRNSKNS